MKQFKTINQNKADIEIGYKQEIKLEEVFNDEKKENIKKFIDEINNPSQPNQALEEAAENKYGLSNQYSKNRIGFIEGAKWQQERMYSEEEVMDILLLSYSSISDKSLAGADLRKWFEQFKKK